MAYLNSFLLTLLFISFFLKCHCLKSSFYFQNSVSWYRVLLHVWQKFLQQDFSFVERSRIKGMPITKSNAFSSDSNATTSFFNSTTLPKNPAVVQTSDGTYTVWETLKDPKKLFPYLNPLEATVLYIALFVLLALLVLLVVWVVTVWCQENSIRKRKERLQNSFLARDLFSQNSMSSFGSVGCLSTLTSSSFGNDSFSSLLHSRKCTKKNKKSHRTFSQKSHDLPLKPTSCGAATWCRKCSSVDRSKLKRLKKAKSFTEKSSLLRNSSLYVQSHSGFLSRCPSHASNASSLRDGYCRNCYVETSFGRSCELPRANWSSDKIFEFMRDQANKIRTDKPTDYGTLTESLNSFPNASNAPTIKAETSGNGTMSRVDDQGSEYETNFLPPPPLDV